MTDFLVRFVHHLKRGIKDHWDYVIVVDGREGSGKSTLAAHLKAIYDGSYNLDRVTFDARDMIDRMKDAPRGSFLLVDEAIVSMYKREAMQDFQVALAKAFSIVRARNLVFCLVLPNYFDLDPHLRTRTNWRLYCYAQKGVRGYVDFYRPDRNPWTRGDPYLELRFKAKFGVMPERFQGAYDEFKSRHLMDALSDFKREVQEKVAAAQTRNDYGRVGTKLQKAHRYLSDNPGATPDEVAAHVTCSIGYAREIIRTARVNARSGD